MSTKYAKVPSANSGKDFITHNDWEVNRLQFSVLADKDGFMYVKVEGEDAKIGEWVKRVGGTETTSTIVNDIIATFSPPIEERLTAIENELDKVKIDVNTLKAAK